MATVAVAAGWLATAFEDCQINLKCLRAERIIIVKQGVFVVRRGDGWGVRTGGASRLARSFETQRAAIDYGRSVAINNQTELRVQRTNGQFGICNSYGNDTCPPHDKNR